MKKKRWTSIAMLVLVLVGIYAGLHSQRLLISYEKIHVNKLGNGGPAIGYVQVYELNDPPVILYNPAEDFGDPGDFIKIKVKLKGHEIFELGSYGWIKVLERSKGLSTAVMDGLKLPEGSQKVVVYPYFIRLDMDSKACILVFFGYPYASMPGLLTLLYVDQDKAEVIFNKEVDLDEIAETDKGGYRLVGRLGGREYEANPCEILIEDGKLSFRRLPFEKVYENQAPSFVLYDCVGWGCNKQPGDFMRIQPTQEEQVTADNSDGFWRKVDPSVKTPETSQRIKRCPYFIMLDDVREGSNILVLCGCNYNGEPADYLRLVRVSSSYASFIAYMYNFKLKEVAETERGYRLIGTTVSEGGEERYCERIIENGKWVR